MFNNYYYLILGGRSCGSTVATQLQILLIQSSSNDPVNFKNNLR